MNRKTYEFIQTKQTLNKVKEERMPFDWSINPYRGCAHGCSFCYARAFQSFIGMGAEDEFQNHILIKENAAEALEVQLARIAKRIGQEPNMVGSHVGLINIGTATDPYQPVEAESMKQITNSLLDKYKLVDIQTEKSKSVEVDRIAPQPLMNTPANYLR